MLNASAIVIVFILDRTTLTSILVNFNVSSIQTAIMPKDDHDLMWKMGATVMRAPTGRLHESLTITVDVL